VNWASNGYFKLHEKCRKMVRKPLADREGIWTELQTANDRAAVILAATFVEEAILEAIIDSLKIERADALEELIGNNAPLGTFSNKIMIAHCVGIIGEKARRDSNVIRRIRNIAAHQMEPFSLNENRFRDMTSHFSVRYYPMVAHQPHELPESPRERYVETCEKIAMRLDNSEPLFSGEKRPPEAD
jgi:hypothetical protein